jgi:hypothetical protein
VEINLSLTCPECGAKLNDNTTCEEMFNSLLALEFNDPAYGQVHMLTLACYMIQHGRYSDEALAWIEEQLRANLEDGISSEQIRRHAARETSPGKRSWKVTRRPGAKPLPKVAWSMTIADIAGHYQDAAGYCGLIKQWARTTLKEMKPLQKPLSNGN